MDVGKLGRSQSDRETGQVLMFIDSTFQALYPLSVWDKDFDEDIRFWCLKMEFHPFLNSDRDRCYAE